MDTIDIAQILDRKFDSLTYAREWKTRQRSKRIAYLLPDVPEEIIHAAGCFPLPIMDLGLQTPNADSLLPQFLCSIIKQPLEMALDGTLDFIDGMVIPYVCDSTRAFSHVWEANFPSLFNHTLWLPKKHEGKSSKSFLVQEFRRLKENLESFIGKEITSSALKKSLSIYNLNRKLLKELFDIIRGGKTYLNYTNFLNIVKTTMVMPKEESNNILMNILKEINCQNAPSYGAHGRKYLRVFLFGIMCNDNTILNIFQETGLSVVDDNLYHGTRYFSQNVDEGHDPLEGLVKRHLAKDPFCAYHYPEQHLKAYLMEKIRENSIDGFIYLSPKYCDPFEFDYPFVKGLLQEMRIPHLFLQIDFSSASESQIRTRLEAFAEMLRGEV